MSKYIFLDTWALSTYTKAQYAQQLTNFIQSNGYTLVLNGLSMTEVYNPGWKGGGPEERGAIVAHFLKNHHCVVIEPEEIWKEEHALFPHQLENPPIKLDLDTIPMRIRGDAILQVLRGSSDLSAEGIGVEQWSDTYKVLKSQWRENRLRIIDEGVRQGLLIKDRRGKYKAASREKREEFLRSLDWRLAPPKAEYSAEDDTSVMRGIRCANLCFWYQYVDPPSSSLPSVKASDVGDIFQASLLPYCHAFTADTKMAPTIRLALKEVTHSCRILTQHDLDME